LANVISALDTLKTTIVIFAGVVGSQSNLSLTHRLIIFVDSG